ncbi:hypothetical protein F2P81_016575 [Scophthalmus maximus]|uniref:Uncharacterized protein n=1 Tax=Scophthalmus maximus TaxID=52904 RepID=A0A6A4SJH6_SCOMX|nr:hypothetical protein F2P81_016575 [Scophthalmus maximus]
MRQLPATDTSKKLPPRKRSLNASCLCCRDTIASEGDVVRRKEKVSQSENGQERISERLLTVRRTGGVLGPVPAGRYWTD